MKTIPREALVPILWQEIANRADEDGMGGITACALAIAASKKMTYGSAYRRIEQILKGDYLNRRGETIVQQDVTFEVADNILTGLDRQDAWYRELAGFLPELPDLDVVGGWCKRCRLARSSRRVSAASTVRRFSPEGEGGDEPIFIASPEETRRRSTAYTRREV